MPESDEFWDFYWEVSLREIADLGKREAILAASKRIRKLSERPGQSVRLLELGCGQGQVIGPLVKAHAQVRSIDASCGVDYSHQAVEACRQAYPGISFIEGDFTDQDLMAGLGKYEIVLLVNALHEVFSASYSPELEGVAVEEAKRRVAQALAGAVECLVPGGCLVLFDGLEPSGDIHRLVRIRFRDWQVRRDFDTFVREYRPFRIEYREAGDPYRVELSLHDFTRYITKSIFLGKPLWQTERLESYQYFNQEEFERLFSRLELVVCELRTLTVSYEKWRSVVEIETPGVDFPAEHILVLAQKPGDKG